MTLSKLKVMSVMAFTLATGVNASCDVSFTESQLDVMTRAYVTGQPESLGYTLAAISWRESKAGKDIVRMGNSLKWANLGAFQNQVKSTGDRAGCKTQKCYADVAYKLVTDQRYASHAALNEMRYWLDRHNSNMRKALASYNSGSAHNSKSRSYAVDVSKKTKYLQKCVSFAGRPVINKTDPSVLADNTRTLKRLKRLQ